MFTSRENLTIRASVEYRIELLRGSDNFRVVLGHLGRVLYCEAAKPGTTIVTLSLERVIIKHAAKSRALAS